MLRFVHTVCAGTPQQRKEARYRLLMQCRGIDIRWNSVADLGLSEAHSESHGNSGGPGLEVVLRTLDISPADSILDIGCGKGGAMLTLAQWPFGRVDGIEISGHLIQIAKRNLARLGRVRGTIRKCDAAQFQEYDPYTFFYMYNPFPEIVMKDVLENIRSSLSRISRRATFIYKNPVCHELVVGAGFRQISQLEHTVPLFRIYSWQHDANS